MDGRPGVRQFFSPRALAYPQTDEQVRKGADHILKQLDVAATRAAEGTVLVPVPRSAAEATSSPGQTPSIGIRVARVAELDLRHLNNTEVSMARLDEMLEALAEAAASPATALPSSDAAVERYELSSVLKKRKKKMNKHKYKKRLKMTRALRKSLKKI